MARRIQTVLLGLLGLPLLAGGCTGSQGGAAHFTAAPVPVEAESAKDVTSTPPEITGLGPAPSAPAMRVERAPDGTEWQIFTRPEPPAP